MREWYCLIDADRYGPMGEAELRQWVGEGRLRPHDLVWTPEMPDWAPAGTVEGLFAGSSASPGAPLQPGIPQAGGPPGTPLLLTAPITPPTHGACVAGMVLGIVSLACFCVPVLNLGCSLTGLILSIVGLRRSRKTGARGGVGLAGVITSSIGLAIATFITIGQLVNIIWGNFDAFNFNVNV